MNNRVNMNYKYRRLVIILLISVILVFIGLTAYKIIFTGVEDKDNVILQGAGYSKIDYQVALEPNDIYEDTTISGMDFYLGPFTKYIQIYASAGANVPSADKVTCISSGNIYLMSKIDMDGSQQTIWTKEYPCFKEETMVSKEGVVDVKRDYKVRLTEYNELISSLAEEYGFYSIYELHIVFNGEFIVEKDGVTESIPFTTSATLNLNDVIYRVNIINDDNIDVTIKQTYKAKKEVDLYSVLIFVGMILVFSSILVYILMKTDAVKEVDIYHNKVATIMREYHSRLAQLSKTLTYQASVMISIEEFEDLIKIADEIGQMVFYYEINEADERKIEFYVFDDARIYYLVMFG